MVTLVELLQRLYEELKVVANDSASLSNTDEHVGVLNRTKDIETPFFGFEWQRTPYSYGFGGNQRITEVNSTDGSIDSVDRTRDYVLNLDVGVVVDGDSPRKRDTYFSNVDAHFADFVDDPTALNEDVDRVRDEGTLPGTGMQGGDSTIRTSYSIRFSTTDTDSIVATETVNFDLDADSVDTYPEQY